VANPDGAAHLLDQPGGFGPSGGDGVGDDGHGVNAV
jgi:hypothetical protein